MLKIEKLTKTYGNKNVLQGIDLTLDRGEILTLLGKNGAGKTTLLNCILKLTIPDAGMLYLNDTDIRQIPQKHYFSEISAVLESSENMYSYLSGMQNIKYAASLMGIKFSSITDQVYYYADMFDLRDALNDKAGSYSRGMQQKLAIIIALISTPSILLLDEPTLGLDIESEYRMIASLKEIVRNHNTGIILTTHQMEVVESIDSKLLILNEGKIQFNGNIRQLQKKYESDIYTVKYIRNGLAYNKQYTADEVQQLFSDRQYHIDIIEITKKAQNIEIIMREELHGLDVCRN